MSKKEEKEEKNKIEKIRKKTLYFAYFRHVFFIFILFILIIIAGSLGFYALLKSMDKEVVVPDLTGVTVIDALDMLQQSNLKGYVVSEFSDKVPMFFVIRQQTPAGFVVKEGREIIFTVSLGTSSLELLDFRGKNIQEVMAFIQAIPLKDRKFFIQDIQWVNSDKPLGEILEQNPIKAKLANQMIGIRFWVSAENTKIMPELTGRFLEEALYRIEKLGLKYKIQYRVVEQAQNDGKIMEQKPKSGEKVFSNHIVSLTVGKWKERKDEVIVIDYTIPEELNRVKIKIIYSDTKNYFTIFEGRLSAGEKFFKVIAPVGNARVFIYKTENNVDKFYQEIAY